MMTNSALAGRKILYSAPLVSQVRGEIHSIYGARQTDPMDLIDLNGNGKADSVQTNHPSYHGKADIGAGIGVKTSEPSFIAPTLAQMKAYAQQSGIEVLGKEHLPNGVFIGEAFGVDSGSASGNSNIDVRPIETLVYKVTPGINPKATWGIDTANNRFVVYEK